MNKIASEVMQMRLPIFTCKIQKKPLIAVKIIVKIE